MCIAHSIHITTVLRRYAVSCIAALLIPLTLLGAEVNYPCRDLIETGDFEQALIELQQQDSDLPEYAVSFAYYMLHSAQLNPQRDLQLAYMSLSNSWGDWRASKPEAIERSKADGFTTRMYNDEFASICVSGFAEAQNMNTADGWSDFLAVFTRATKRQRAEAEQRLYALAYERIAADSTSEEVFLEYCHKYPNSPYVGQAQDRAIELEMHRVVHPADWLSHKSFLLEHPTAGRWRDTVMHNLARYVRKTQHVDAAKWGMLNLSRPYSDSCWLTMRNIHLEDTTLQTFVRFHDMYRSRAIESVQQSDRQMVKAHERYRQGALTAEQYILLVAPAYPAYYRLQSLIKEDIKAKRWSEALATVKSFREVFAGDKRYNDLLRVLQEYDDPKIAATPVGTGVNTPDGNEFCPTITADGKQLYFCGTKRAGNIGGEDIFMSKRIGNSWGKASAVNDLNTAEANEAPLGISADGTTMMAFRSGKLMVSHRTKKGWTPLEPLSADISISEWMADAMITSDGKALLFAAMSQTPHELQMSINIFVSLLQDDGTWGKPFELGPTINTQRIDRSPFMHPDMHTLYFCSEGHGSLGKMDVFVSTRLNDSCWTEWSEPVNMGKTINTAGNECWYKISTDGSLAYFSKRVDGQNDLFQLSLPEHLRPKPVATIAGVVTDSQGEPVATTIRWEDLQTRQFVGQTRTDPTDGSFFIVLPEGKSYWYYVFDDRFAPASYTIDLTQTNEFITLENNITVAPR
jgi:WD40-like Beta Propeller Repeat.